MASEFLEDDYVAMMCDIHKHDPLKYDYLEIFPTLRMYPEFKVDLGDNFNKSQVLSYIILVYDRASPIRRKYADLGQRKYEALKASKFNDKKGQFGKWVDFMVGGGIPEVNAMIVAYVRAANSTKWAKVVTAEALFYSYLKSSLEGDTKLKSSEIDNVENMLINAQRDLLAEDNNKELIQTLYKKIASAVDYSPEVVAEKIKTKGYDKVFEDED